MRIWFLKMLAVITPLVYCMVLDVSAHGGADREPNFYADIPLGVYYSRGTFAAAELRTRWVNDSYSGDPVISPGTEVVGSSFLVEPAFDHNNMVYTKNVIKVFVNYDRSKMPMPMSARMGYEVYVRTHEGNLVNVGEIVIGLGFADSKDSSCGKAELSAATTAEGMAREYGVICRVPMSCGKVIYVKNDEYKWKKGGRTVYRSLCCFAGFYKN